MKLSAARSPLDVFRRWRRRPHHAASLPARETDDIAPTNIVLSRERPEILVIGGVVMDFRFQVPWWPQPDEAVQGTFRPLPGGKGLNQAAACARMGARTAIVSAVAADNYGDELCRMLRERESIDTRIYRADPGQQSDHTDVTAVVVADGKPAYIGCRSGTNYLTAQWVEQSADLMRDARVVCITFDIPPSAVLQAVELAHQYRKRLVLNAAPPATVPFSVLDGVDYVVLSEWEAREWLANSDLHPREYIESMTNEQIGYRLLEHGAQTVVITAGSKGSLAVSVGRSERRRSFRVKETDTAGASDAFCAGLAIALSRELARKDQIRFASAAAALACTHEGTYDAMPQFEAVEAFLAEHTDERLEELELVESTQQSQGGLELPSA